MAVRWRGIARTWRTLLASVNVLLMFYCVMLLAVILYQHPMRFDLSAQRVNTLCDDTMTCLNHLVRPVEVIAAFGERDPRKMLATRRIFRRVEDVLRQMALSSDKIKVINAIDVFIRAETWERLKKRYGLTNANRVILISGGRRQEVRLDDMADLAYGPKGGARIRSFRVERAIASALRRLQGKPLKVYVLENEGTEGRVGPTIRDTSLRGFSEMAAELKANNYSVESLNLKSRGKVPRDCDVLLSVGLIGPLPEEMPFIIDYLRRGGKFLLALNPLVEPAYLGFLNDWGFRIEPAWTVMEASLFGTTIQTERVLVTGFNPVHPITRKFEKDRFRMIMVYARPISAVKGRYAEREGIVFAKGKNIWGERRIDDQPWVQGPNDIPSPITVVAVSEAPREKGEPARIAVFGSANFLSNRDIRMADHLSVFHNTMWWLVGQEELVSVRAPEDVERNVGFDAEGNVRRLLSWTFLAVVPGCAILIGLAAFFLRRR